MFIYMSYQVGTLSGSLQQTKARLDTALKINAEQWIKGGEHMVLANDELRKKQEASVARILQLESAAQAVSLIPCLFLYFDLK